MIEFHYVRHLVKRNFRSSSGFSLIEILISMFLLGLMLVFFQSSFSTTTLTRTLQREDIAVRIVDQEMEDLRAATYAGLPSSGSFTNALLSSIPNGLASTTLTDFNVDTKQVLVGVSWQESSTSPVRYLSATTLITKSGGL